MSNHERASPSAQPTSGRKQADRKHQEALLDAALAESFPASDPTSTLHADEPVKGQERGDRRPPDSFDKQ